LHTDTNTVAVRLVMQCKDPKNLLSRNPVLRRTGTESNLIVEFPLKKGSVSVNESQFNCTIGIVSRLPDNRMSLPETINASFIIQFYNAPLGEISDNVKKEIDIVKSSALVQGQWIGQVQSVFDIAQRICGVIQSVSAVVTAISTAWTVISGVNVFVEGILTPLAESLAGSYQGVQSGWIILSKSVGYTCAISSCSLWDKLSKDTSFGVNLEGFGYLDFLSDWYEDRWSDMFGALPADIAPNVKNEIKSKLNPKESLVLSIFSLCVPGVIYNLQKARNIECKYISCLQKDVPQGAPIFTCMAAREYSWCSYVYGEVFELIPIAKMWDELMNYISTALSDWVALSFALIGLGCSFELKNILPPVGHVLASTCAVFNAGRTAYSLGVEISQIFTMKNYFTITEDSCKDVLEDKNPSSSAAQTAEAAE